MRRTAANKRPIESKASIAVRNGLFTTAEAAAAHFCECADVVFRNNHDGSRTYKLRGQAGCGKCHGLGAHQPCTACNATGMTPPHVCRTCHGAGKVPLQPRHPNGKPVYA